MPEPGPRRARALSALALVALVVLGALARGRLYLARTSYWYDEAYLLLNVFDRSFATLVGPLGNEQAAPPLFLFSLRALYLAAGGAEWAMRLPAFAASLAALAVMVPLARAAVGRRGALVAAGLGAVCYHGVTHGSEVKPYALDLLATEVLLLAGAAFLTPAPGGRRWPGPALLAAAVVAPWCSFPSVFSIGAVSSAVLTAAWRGRAAGMWRFWCAFNLAALVSCLALWWVAARHLSTPGLRQFWGDYFPDLSSPGRAALWTLRYLVETANYGATGLGVPLLLLAAAGLTAVARRSPEVAVLLAAPPALAWVAGAAGKYPLGDRLVFFAAPCVWLAAAAGGVALLRRLRFRPAAVAALAAALLLPGAARMLKHLPRTEGKSGFREAFALVDARRRPGEALFVSHPEVYEVYHARPPRPDETAAPLECADGSPVTGGVWVVTTPQQPGLTLFPQAFEHLRAAAGPPRLHQSFNGIEVSYYEPAGR